MFLHLLCRLVAPKRLLRWWYALHHQPRPAVPDGLGVSSDLTALRLPAALCGPCGALRRLQVASKEEADGHVQDMLRRYPQPVLLDGLRLYSRLGRKWRRTERTLPQQSRAAESATSSPTASFRRKVLFFSRGLGMGHATRDIAIVQTLQSLAPDVEVTFASYARGLPLLRNAGYAPIDLGLPPQGWNNQRLLRIAQLIREQQPHLVVSDEELLALPLARLQGVLPLLITNWLIEEQRYPEAD